MTRNGRIARTPASTREPDPPVGPPQPAQTGRGSVPGRAGTAAPELARLAQGLLVDPSGAQRRSQQTAATEVLSWLASFPGQDWQDRWLLSGSDLQGSSWGPAGLSRGRRGAFTTGLGAVLALRAVRPSYGWLFSSRLLGVYDAYRRHNEVEVFTALDRRLAERGGNAEHGAKALNLLTRMVIATGKDVMDLDVGDFTDYAAARESSGRPTESLGLAYQVLHAHGGLPGCPPTLVEYHHIGKRSPAELVDRYPIANRAVRDVLVHYLTERCAMLDYASLVNQSQMLAGLFWADLERHHPGIGSVNLPESVADAWKQRIRVLPDGRPRLNYHAVLLAVRAFYLDLRQWSLEDPARWAGWAAPCPIRQADVHSYLKETRLRQARMQQRTRTLAPVLGRLVAAAEDRAAPGRTGGAGRPRRRTRRGVHRGRHAVSAHRAGRSPLGPIAVFITTADEPGPRVNAERDEDNAFWIWAAIEVLRRTGVRIEELLELTHLSLRQYQAPTDEMVPLLQISPSKTDRERVIPADPDLVAVLARILRRVKATEDQVPLLSRYDGHERTFGPPLPHLFQTVFQHRRQVINPGARTQTARRPGRQGRDRRCRRHPTAVHPARLPAHLRHRDRQRRPADPHRRQVVGSPRPEHHPGVRRRLSAGGNPPIPPLHRSTTLRAPLPRIPRTDRRRMAGIP